MSRGLKIALGLLVALAALLLVNMAIVDNQTEEAEATIDGGQILELPGGEVQVYEQGPSTGSPIVLLHCYGCSLHWWDRLAPILARDHRVIRIDLLGHGGSQKPSGGYEIEEQAALVAGALDQLGVQGAVVVGHSMGFSVATALAERATQLVDRLVNIDDGPNGDLCELSTLAEVAFAPVIGQALWRVSPDFAVEDGYSSAFAPGYEIADGFDDPDQVIADHDAMTYTAFREASDANSDYVDELALDQRLRQIPVPLLSIFGTEDQICDPEESQAAYGALPGARTADVRGAGHSPNVEKPAETAALINEFALDPGDDTAGAPPRNVGQRKRKRSG